MSSKTRKTLPENRTNRLSVLIESELEKAELVIAVKAITDKLQDMAEALAKIEADEIMPMLDSLKTAFGPQVAEQFSNTATEQVRQLVTAISGAKDAIGNEVLRLEKSVNGGAGNDMAMPSDDAMGGDPLGGDSLGGDTDDLDAEADDLLANGPGGDGAPGGDRLAGGPDGAPGGGLPDEGGMAPPKMTAAGRDKKESATRRGRRLVEYTSANFEANLHNLTAFDPRAGALAHGIHDQIDQARFDGNERAALANVLSHLAMCASDLRHWEDPDAKVETALQSARVDVRLPEVRSIVSKLKKLAHLIGLKHDGMMESKRLNRNINTLREAKDPDKLVLQQFLLALKETRNTTRSIQAVASRFAIEPNDVVVIVREAKRAAVAEGRHRVPFGARPAVRPPPGPSRSAPTRGAPVKEVNAAQRRGNGHGNGPSSVGRSSTGPASWRGMIEGDTKLAEAQPAKPKSPAEMRADYAAQQAQQSQSGAPPAARRVAPSQPAQQAQPAQATPQGKPPGAVQKPAQTAPQGGPAATAAPTQGDPRRMPLPAQNVPPVLPGAKTSAGTPAVTPNGQPAAGQPVAGQQIPGQQTTAATPVGQSPQNPTAAQAGQGGVNLPNDLPGKALAQLPADAVTLMSKPAPFPKAGPPLVGGTGQAAPRPANESRKRGKTGAKPLTPAVVKPGKTRLAAKPARR